MNPIKLSYVTSTMNKLPYLKIALERLMKVRKSDEEIMVADGGSTDGTKEYLEKLFKEGKIDYFTSGKDAGESHALNKLFLKARGEVITLITDDDAFDHKNIQECKKFMIEHPEIDMLGTDGGKKDQDPTATVRRLNYTPLFEKWKKNHTPFMTCGLGLMLRTSSLPILGLWNPPFSRADAEFMLRVTSGKSKLAWYSNPSFVNISNPLSVSVTKMKKIFYETQRLEQMYLGRVFVQPAWYVELRAKLSKLIKGEKKNTIVASLALSDWEKILLKSEDWLAQENSKPGQFHY
jgi:glycosyltransferase involved in cell wall biosynthesis